MNVSSYIICKKNNTNLLNDMHLSKTQFSKNAIELASIANELTIKELRFLSINNRIGVNTFLFETEKFELQNTDEYVDFFIAEQIHNFKLNDFPRKDNV